MRLSRLDTLRTVAILMVIASHHYLVVELGWAGVDLFFVLSGFLITRILRSSFTRRSYWSRFYLKRAVRILPPLLILFVVAFLLSRHIPLPTFIGYGLFLGNVMNVTKYRNGLFVVLWSLAVEEHFYIFWPFAVRFLSRRNLLLLLAAVLVTEPILRSLATPHVSTFEPIFLLTPFRLDGLAAGAMLALLTEHVAAERWLSRWSFPGLLATAAVFGLLRSLLPTFTRDQNSVSFNGAGYTLIAATCFFIVAWVLLLPKGSINTLLSAPPLVYLGRISYGMYLLHIIVITVLKKRLHIPFGVDGITETQRIFPLELAITIGLAAISFQFYEKPILAWGSRQALRLEAFKGDPSESEQAAVVETSGR